MAGFFQFSVLPIIVKAGLQGRAHSSEQGPGHSAGDFKQLKLRLIMFVAVLCAILLIELIIPARGQSVTHDEGVYLLSGYSYWTKADYGLNPEHPPLPKLLVSLPLLTMSLRYPPLPDGFFKHTEFAGGREFLYFNNADAMLFRARLVTVALSAAAALLVFIAAYRMFGGIPALLALLLFVFEPSLIAHGSLATTDMCMTLFLFATIFCFYRYVTRPSWWRLLLTGVAAGLALTSKHSGVLWIPVLLLLSVLEVARRDEPSPLAGGGKWKHAFRLAGALACIGLTSVVLLWSVYGFRFDARPKGQSMDPSFAFYVGQMHWPHVEGILSFVAHYHLLPESYLYGFADLIITPQHVNSYLLGHIYSGHGLWWYFPVAFAIKSTISLMLLLLLLPFAIRARDVLHKREPAFFLVPSALYFLVAVWSGFNIGVRHILPIYPFLIVLAAFGASQLMSRHVILRCVAVVIFAFQVFSSARAFPHYLPYANELWGGSADTYKYLADSNVDWGQQLKSIRKYLDERRIKDCWLDYSGRVVVDPGYYGIPCKPLPDSIMGHSMQSIIPARVEGTVLISVAEVSGVSWGPDLLNPYSQFQKLRPDDSIADSVLVFRGQFDLPLAAGISHAGASLQLTRENKAAEGLAEAQIAVGLAPNDVSSQFVLGYALLRLERKGEAKQAFQRALGLAQTVHPEFQTELVPVLKGLLNNAFK